MSNRININSDYWGSKGWYFIDTIVLSYPDKPTQSDKDEFFNFFQSIKKVLPCEKCRVHFSEYLYNHPLNDKILSSKEKLIKWILAAHNNVRKMQNKKEITLNEFFDFYIRENKLEINKTTSEVKIIEKFYLPNVTSVVGIICFFILIYLFIALRRNWY